jgi:hypothetical protein
MYERLTKVVNELERVVFSLDKDKPMGENEALAAEFFRIFRDFERIIPEYEEVRNFPSFFDELDLLEYSNVFFVDWNSRFNSYIARWDEKRRVEFLKDRLQALVWGLVGKALKYLPQGGEALAQAYEDLLNGLEEHTDTDTLEILYQLGLDRAKAYTDYMSMKEKYKDQIKDLRSLLGFRQIISLLKKNGLNYPTRVKVNDWWSKIYLFSQLDTALLNEFDSFALQLLSLDTLIKLEKIYMKKGLREVQDLLSPSESGLNGATWVEASVRSKVLSKLLGEDALQRLKGNPTLIPQLRKQLESCIADSLQMLDTFMEKRLESCLKTEENRVMRIGVKDPPFTVIYHTFFSPIIWEGRRERTTQKQASEATIEEIVKEIEAFNPDRYKDFPLWWAKEKYKEKISQIDENKKEKLIKLFYKMMKGDLAIDKYHRELSSL